MYKNNTLVLIQEWGVARLRDLSEISRGEGVETEGGSQLLRLRKGRGHEKWAVKRGRVRQIYAREHVEVHPQNMLGQESMASLDKLVTVRGPLLPIVKDSSSFSIPNIFSSKMLQSQRREK